MSLAQVISALNSSKKGTQLPLKTSIDNPLDLILFWSINNDKLEAVTYGNFLSTWQQKTVVNKANNFATFNTTADKTLLVSNGGTGFIDAFYFDEDYSALLKNVEQRYDAGDTIYITFYNITQNKWLYAQLLASNAFTLDGTYTKVAVQATIAEADIAVNDVLQLDLPKVGGAGGGSSSPELFTGVSTYETNQNGFTVKGIRQVTGDLEGFAGVSVTEGVPVMTRYNTATNGYGTFSIDQWAFDDGTNTTTWSIVDTDRATLSSNNPNFQGIVGGADFSANYVDNSFVQKVYIDNIRDFKGAWNAATNTPTLSNTDTNAKGFEYLVTTSGTFDFGAGSITFGVGDIVANDGSVWYKKVDNGKIERINTIEIPTGFNNPFGALIIKRGLNGAELLSIDKDTYRKKLNVSTDRYVDSVNGNDANNGLTWATAYKTLQQAYDDTPDRIYLVGGQNYWRLAAGFVNDVELISVGGKSTYCYGITGDERTWTDQTGGVWSNVLSASIQGVFDTTSYDVNGFPVAYQEMTNLTDVQNTSGSFWKDGATNTLYIHTTDDLTPDRNSIVAQISEVTISSAVSNFHTDNITFFGGLRYLSGNTSKDSFYRTDFIYSDVNGYFSSMINKYVYLEGCSAYRNFDDGFDYDGSTNAIEVNCIAFENGYNASTGINNGSTAHTNAKVLRINGIYHSNEGPNLHDVNDAKSLNIDCVAYNSTSSVSDNKSAFACGLSTDAAEMWLDGCSTKNDDTFGAEIRSANATIFIRNTDIKNIEAGTSLTSY